MVIPLKVIPLMVILLVVIPLMEMELTHLSNPVSRSLALETGCYVKWIRMSLCKVD